jgi:PKD domain
MVFMIARIVHPVASLALLVGLAILTSACQKVPLLAPGGSVITLTASVTVLPINGSAELIAQVVEPAGTPPQRGTLISFTTTLGSIEPSQAETDLSGRAIVRFRAGPGSGSAIITAISGGVAVTSANALKILVGTAAIGNVRVSASPTLLPATGGVSTITAQALDINGNALSTAPVSFSTTAGTLDQSFATTDQNGTAAVILRTTTAATVTAAVGAQAGSTTPPPATGGAATPTTPAASGTATGSVTVNVSAAPTLVITPPATAPSAGLPSTFTFAVTVPATNGSAIRSVTVDWGDGQIQELGAITTAAVAHTYRNPGSYTVKGTATDSFGNVVNVSITVAVNPKPQPVVSITTTTTNPTAGTDMTFTGSVAPATGTGTVIQNVTVDFGDGNGKTDLGPVTGTITLHKVFVTGGTYVVTLQATDSNGGVGTGVTTVFVQGATPLAVTLTSSQVSSGTNTTVTFTATVIGLGNAVVVNYHWVFGGPHPPADNSSNVQTRTYTAGSGPITVSVTVKTSDGRESTGVTVITP